MEKFLRLKSKTEDLRRRELILNITLIFSILMFFMIDCMVIHQSVTHGLDHDGIGITEMTFVIVMFSGLYYLSRIGYIKTASYLLIAIYFIAVSVGSYYFGISLPSILLSYALIITIATILISSKFGFGLSLLTLLTMLVIGSHEIKSPESIVWKEHPLIYGDIITYGFFLIMITVISWLSNRETEKSLIRARKSEAELKTERDSLEIKVEERTRELKQAHIEKVTHLSRFAEFGKLSSGLFHDLMNPLTSIALNVKEIKGSTQTDMSEQVDNAIKASQKMDKFLSSIRKQIRTEEFYENFCVNTIIEEVMVLFKHRALRAKIDLIFKATSEIHLYGNPIKFHQIISNLISNAIDAYDGIPENKERQIKIKLEKHSSGTPKEGFSVIVSDKGAGIKPEDISKIFEQFFTTKSADKGTGLGLYMTKEIIEKEFGGKIGVTSNPQTGTIFTVKIPNAIDTNKQNNIQSAQTNN